MLTKHWNAKKVQIFFTAISDSFQRYGSLVPTHCFRIHGNGRMKAAHAISSEHCYLWSRQLPRDVFVDVFWSETPMASIFVLTLWPSSSVASVIVSVKLGRFRRTSVLVFKRRGEVFSYNFGHKQNEMTIFIRIRCRILHEICSW